jgi:protochlorophyllide reductase
VFVFKQICVDINNFGEVHMSNWTVDDIPDLHDRIVIVTGANSGLGLETTKALAAKGAHVIMACRSAERGRVAFESVKKLTPGASLELAALDLASLASIRDFAAQIQHSYERLDLLFNNAGIMAIPRRETKDGFEMQFGTNHLGHFALTGLLLSTLLATPQSRVITTSSLARYAGKIDFDDINHQHSYGRWSAYGQSKTANLLFAFELQSRLAQTNASTISVAAHPGYANTNLQSTTATEAGSAIEQISYKVLGAFFGQPQSMGVLPQLYAGTALTIFGGELVGPGGFFGTQGYPNVETRARKEYDRAAAERLWNISVELTGVDYKVLQSVETGIEGKISQ